jgi:SAM-dependent methyltransferase
MTTDRRRLIYSAAIVAASMLLFAVQPIFAKAMLPRFGGSAGVWVTCMLFFQVLLLLGYLYAYLLTRYLNGAKQVAVHAGLVAAGILLLPLKPPGAVADMGHPARAILAVLLARVGLPYFLLATNSPLLQFWYARSGGKFPYGLFAWSNFASLAALLAYPVFIEPSLAVEQQLWWWSAGFIIWAVLLVAVVVGFRGRPLPGGRGSESALLSRDRQGAVTSLMWIALAACASVMWLAVANHLSQEVAPIPFLWVLPLSVYLLTFILCFEGTGWYRPAVFRWLLPVACIAIAYFLRSPSAGIQWQMPVLLASLFVCCMFCHGELARTRPDARSGLPFFYVMVASGGALGGVFVGVIAPAVFDRFLELPLAITACVLLGLPLLYGYPVKRLIRLGVFAAAAFIFAVRFQGGGDDVVRMRNFYGALQISDSGRGEAAVRCLYNGRTIHGRQFLAADLSRMPIAFYGPGSGPAVVLGSVQISGRRLGIIGLGVGTLAAYGQPGDDFRFYEINPAVVQVAYRYFRYLSESAARVDVVTADGRLGIEQEPPAALDVVVVDAFADDSIPAHLLTMEAFEIYFRRLRPGGVLLMNLTNRYLDLSRVVEAAAAALNKQFVMIHSGGDPARQTLPADWAVVSGDREFMSGIAPFSAPPPAAPPRLWTDAQSNLFQVLK